MSRFSVYCGGMLVGHSDLEHRDAGMGVALGRFYPSAGYAAVRARCISATKSGHWERLNISVRSPQGALLVAEGGIMILDAETIDPAEAEVHVAGISTPPFADLFPEAVASYIGATE